MFNYTHSLSVSTGKYVTLTAPPDHINVHIREGNILAMQGEAMTKQAARKTPFHLLVVISNCEATTGKVFLDDGVEVTMGGEGGRWSLVKFSAKLGEESLTIASNVVNGGFAMNQKWVIDKVTILGLTTGVKIKGYAVHRGTLVTQGKWLGITSTSDDEGQSVESEISGLNLLIGQDFKLGLKLERVMQFRNLTKCQ